MDTKKYFFGGNIKGRHQQAVAPDVAKALVIFCEQEPEFEQAVAESGKTFQECLNSVCTGIRNSISDLEAYKRAVRFYFSTADVHFNMTIDLTGENNLKNPPITMTQHMPESLSVSLDELLDF